MKALKISLVAVMLFAFQCGDLYAAEKKVSAIDSNNVDSFNIVKKTSRIPIDDSNGAFQALRNVRGDELRNASFVMSNYIYEAGRNDEKLIEIANELMVSFINPDHLKIAYKNRDKGVLTLRYALDAQEITVNVDIKDRVAYFGDASKRLADIALDTRKNAVEKTGLDIKDIYVNRIEALNMSMIYPNPLKEAYLVSSRIDKYTIKFESLFWAEPYIQMADLSQPMPPSPEILPMRTIFLNSFVDNASGVDHVKEAIDKVYDIFNPSRNSIGVQDWRMAGGVLNLSMNLELIRNPYEKFSFVSIIDASVDLGTGQITMNEKMVNIVLNARSEVSDNLGVSYQDVHVNSISASMSLKWDAGREIPAMAYSLTIRAGQFDVYIEGDPYKGTLRLYSIKNIETGQDILENALKYLISNSPNDTFVLTDWALGEGNRLDFTFSAGSGAIVKVSVDVSSGVIRNYHMDLYKKDGNGVVRQADHENKAYDENGTLRSWHKIKYIYDENGVMREGSSEWRVYDQFGMPAGAILQRSMFDTAGRLTYRNSMSYGADEKLQENVDEYHWYDMGYEDYALIETRTYEYGADGRVAATRGEENIYINGALDFSLHRDNVYTYDENGKLRTQTTDISTYDGSGTLMFTNHVVYNYAPDGNVEKWNRYSVWYRYDSQGKLSEKRIESCIYDGASTLRSIHKLTFKYDENSTVREASSEWRVYDENGNAAGSIIQKSFFDVSGRITHGEGVAYDSEGKIQQETIQDHWYDINWATYYTADYLYYDDGTIKEKKTDDNLYIDGILRTSVKMDYSYDESGLLKMRIVENFGYDENGQLISYTINKYDGEGNLLESSEPEADNVYNEDMDQRLAVEGAMQSQRNGAYQFVGQMADGKESPVQPPQQ